METGKVGVHVWLFRKTSQNHGQSIVERLKSGEKPVENVPVLDFRQDPDGNRKSGCPCLVVRIADLVESGCP